MTALRSARVRRTMLVKRAVAATMFAAALIGGTSPVLAEKRFFTIAAVEPKGSATTDKEPFPEAALPDGGGYVLRKPDAGSRWEVSTYIWMPSQIVVDQGDEVTLEFIGINGSSHPTTIRGIDKTIVVKRGTVTQVRFVADKAGVFQIECATHRPSMTAEIIVNARR